MSGQRGNKYLLVEGMFRTGSTFMAKALSAHRNISVPSDPYFYFFKALRNEIFAREGVKGFDDGSPVSDNFFSPYSEINEKIRRYSLDIPIKHNNLDDIKDNIEKLARRDSPMIVPLLGSVKARRYDRLFEELMGLLKDAYGKGNTVYCGFKVIFAEQFLQPLINTYPGLKCIYLVRDPRAIAASQNVYYERSEKGRTYKGRGRYPLMYVIRQWRKSVAYLLDNIEKKENVLALKYEDLVRHPRDKFGRICGFLGLKYDPAMCDADGYKDGCGGQWTQNSSFGTSKSINTRFMDKWKQVLSPKETQIIEDLCSPEMGLLGYKRTTSEGTVCSVLKGYAEDIDKIDPWILGYLDGLILDEKEAQKEIVRKALLDSGPCAGKIPRSFCEKVLIGRDYLNRLGKLRSVKT